MIRYKEIWELVAGVVEWGALVVGGVCLLVYSASIGQFPEDLALGEGIALYVLSGGFPNPPATSSTTRDPIDRRRTVTPSKRE